MQVHPVHKMQKFVLLGADGAHSAKSEITQSRFDGCLGLSG